MSNSTRLPNDLTCKDCMNFEKCKLMYEAHEKRADCDFYPIRFSFNPWPLIEENKRLQSEVKKHERAVERLIEYASLPFKGMTIREDIKRCWREYAYEKDGDENV